MAVSKLVLANGEVPFDLTGDTITAADLAQGKTAHGADGEPIVGTSTYDADTQDATAAAADILNGQTAYVRGAKVTGSMPNNGGTGGVISTLDTPYVIPRGFSDGSAEVTVDPTEAAKLVPGSIKAGVTVLGVEGTYTGEAITAQAKNVTPTFTQQSIIPDDGYDYLSEVVVAAIPLTYTDNAAGGQTLTIG